MESVEKRLNKLREERIAREKARIDKLRDLNLKKYNKNDSQSISRTPSTVSMANRSLKTDLSKNNLKCPTLNHVKNNFHVNGTSKRPISAPMPFKKPVVLEKNVIKNENSPEKTGKVKNIEKVPAQSRILLKPSEKKDFVNSNKIIAKSVNKLLVNTAINGANLPRKSLAPPVKTVNTAKNPSNIPRKSLAPIKITSQLKLPADKPKVALKQKEVTRKSMLPIPPASASKNRESVFDRLYKPKTVQKSELSDADRLQRDPVFLQKVLQQGSLIANKRHTVFAHVAKPVKKDLVRRSISAVHLKRISKKELGNCFQKWSSIDEKLNKAHVTTRNEDDRVKQDTITSAIKSERKRVRLQTPVTFTPRPEELQSRLQKWLKSRGKSIDSYQHLQCFGIHHLTERPLKPLFIRPQPGYDDENKENIAVENDSDNDSFDENINQDDKTQWRGRVSFVSDSICMNDSDHDTTLNSDEAPVDDVLLGALNDLTELLREGFEWEQCARWLRAIRSRFPHCSSLAAYWECRAALEETRGDLPASVQCWEEAIAKGTQHSVVDANLDQLLDKFMQLNISPNSGKRERVDPKLVDVKNVFKSTIIRFAVQQAKLRQSNQSDQPTYIMTPVRRSGRLSSRWSTKVQRTPHPKTPKTPLQICTSVRQAELLGEKVVFVPNATLCNTP